MSWTNRLYETYEQCVSKQQGENAMTPVAHMNASAQIEITLNEEGEFLDAVEVSKDQARTLIPVTEASAGRSSGIAPHALCDTLSYVAGDFALYCDNEKQKKTAERKYESYIENLKKWSESEYTHSKVRSICSYLMEKTLIADLIQKEIVVLNEEQLFDKKKINGQPYEKALVRFRVIDWDSERDGTWEDDSLIRAYTEYYLSMQQGIMDVCYLTGRRAAISENHPKGIVASDYGAKLVSANDAQGYTYRGRFHNAREAYSLSYEGSQKIHSALTWLVKNNGAYIGTQDKRMFICWNPKGKETPGIMDEFGLEKSEDIVDSGIDYRKKLRKMFLGYQEKFDESDSVIVMALDAATTGRLSITYYQELNANEFFRRMIDWGETCNWWFLRTNEQRKLYSAVETPIFKRIVECAYGRERERERERFIEVDDRVLKEQTQRLVKCMLEKQRIPLDLVQALTLRASTPMAYSYLNRERVLSTACAVIRKYHYEKGDMKKGELENMKLDLENRDRSYLFGRLLAVYEYVEKQTYEKGESRETNAIRMQSAYMNHPMQTWMNLENQVKIYFEKLHPGNRERCKKLISEIVCLLEEEDTCRLNQSLKETYLLGYYLQRKELYTKKIEEKEEFENE